MHISNNSNKTDIKIVRRKIEKLIEMLENTRRTEIKIGRKMP